MNEQNITRRKEVDLEITDFYGKLQEIGELLQSV